MDLTTHHVDHTGAPYTGTQRIYYLMSKPSNLGKGAGALLPVSPYLRALRILYRAYRCDTWRSRKGFHRRLFTQSKR